MFDVSSEKIIPEKQSRTIQRLSMHSSKAALHATITFLLLLVSGLVVRLYRQSQTQIIASGETATSSPAS